MKQLFSCKGYLYALVLCVIAIVAFIIDIPAEYAIAVTILPATALQEVNLMTESNWQVNQRDIDQSTIDAATFERLLAAQATLGAPIVQKLTDPNKEWGDVKIWWPDFCGQEAEDCVETGADLCGDLAADPSGVESKSYNIDQCLNDKFSISESTFAGSWMDFRDFLVAEQNQRIRNIINKLNEKALLFLHANAGLNLGGQWLQDGSNRAEVGAEEFDTTLLVTKMMLDAEKSNIRNPFIITGDNQMWITIMNSRFEKNDNTGNAARAAYFDTTLDIRGTMKVPEIAGSTWIVTPYAQAFVSKNYYQSSVPEFDPDLKKWKYHIKIPRYGIRIDVLHQRVCEDAAKDRYNHIFNYRAYYDFLLNPEGCLDQASGKRVTGILEYQNTGINIGSS